MMNTTINASVSGSGLPRNSSTKLDNPEEYTEDLILIFALLGFFGVLTIFANSTVFCLTAKRASLRTKTNAILVSLAASDFLAGFLCIPLIITCNTLRSIETCTAMELAQRFLAKSTILHLLAATLERYLKIVFPLRYFSVLTDRIVAFVLSLIWSTSLFSSLIQLAWMDMNEFASNDGVYSLVCAVVFVLIPFVMMVFAYANIFYVIRKGRKILFVKSTRISRSSKKRKNSEIKAIFIYVAMVVIFLFAWSGYFVFTFLVDIGSDVLDRFPLLDVILLFLKFSTAFINPLLYTFFKADFQSALGSFIKKAPIASSVSSNLAPLNTLANSVTQGRSQVRSKRGEHHKRGHTVPSCSKLQQKAVRSKPFEVYVSSV